MPGAGFEPARLTPYAPQTYVSTRFHHPGALFFHKEKSILPSTFPVNDIEFTSLGFSAEGRVRTCLLYFVSIGIGETHPSIAI